jgi:hypothetical protein
MENDDDNKYAILAIVVVFVLACVAVVLIGYAQVVKADPTFTLRSSSPEETAAQEFESAALADKTFPYVIGGVILFALFVFGGGIAESLGKPLLILIAGVALLGGIGWFFGYMDKDGNGTPNHQVALVVQPTGDDAKNDKAYAEVNTTNADANIKNSVSLAVIWVTFAIVVFIFGFVAQFFKGKEL